MNKKINQSVLIMAGLVGVTTSIGLVLASSITRADDVVDEINITVPVSCSISGTGMDSHNATIANGQYNSAIGETTIKAMCNDSEGLAIYAIGYTDDEDGKNVLTSSTLGNTHDIVTGTATSGNTSNWAMKLTAITSPTPIYPIIIAGSTDDTDKEQGDPDYSTFKEVPDDYVLVAKRKSGTDIGASAEGASFKTTYQAYISSTQPAGTYTGQVKYTLVHPHDTIAPQKPITIETAYANAGKQKYNGYYKIQDMNSTICSNVNQYSGDGMAEVIDVRDNNIYHIAKLADDRCWMLDNLALDPTDPTTAQNMNASNTNATTEAITNLLNGGSSTTGWSNIAVIDVDTNFYNGYTVPRINNASKDTLVTSYGPASTNGQAKVGIYYNYCAATVGTYCYAENGADLPGTAIDAQMDVCPTGWRMPTGGDAGEYYNLAQKYSNTTAGIDSLQYDLSTSLSGAYSVSSASGQNSNGGWWSSTYNAYNNGRNMYGLLVSPTSVDPNSSNGYNRGVGLPVRCLASD